MNETFCILPWIFFSNLPNGNIRICNQTDKVAYDNNNNIYNLNKDDINVIYNSGYYKNIRNNMLNNIKSKECTLCYKKENNNIKSKRQIENENWSHLINENINNLSVKILEIRAGNLCNLKCRMCGPDSSTLFFKEYSDIFPEINIEKYKNLTWYKSDKFKQNFEKLINNGIEHINLIGGEPFIIKDLDTLFDICIDKKVSKNITLNFVTNLFVIDEEKFIKYCNEFKKIKITVSIDGINELAEYIRYPIKWNKFNNNLIYLNNLSYLNLTRILMIAVQLYNIYYLTDIFDYLKNNFNNFINFPNLNVVFHPDHLNIRCLPYQFKILCRDKLLIWKNNNTWLSDHDKSEIDGLITYMMSEDWSRKLKEFKEYTDKLDVYRNQDFNNIWPELNQYLKNL